MSTHGRYAEDDDLVMRESNAITMVGLSGDGMDQCGNGGTIGTLLTTMRDTQIALEGVNGLRASYVLLGGANERGVCGDSEGRKEDELVVRTGCCEEGCCAHSCCHQASERSACKRPIAGRAPR